MTDEIAHFEEAEGIYELINKMRTVQAMNDTSIAETHVRKKINSDSIFLVGYGDLHIENLGTDLDRIETELKIMSEIPNLYVVFMGDLTDSSVKYLNNNFDTYLTPKAAREFGYRIFDALGEKLICALSGCHEKHGEEVADFDYVEDYCKRKHIPFLNERGLLTLELPNDRILNIAVAHKAQGYSMYNPFHPAIRIVREKYPDADVIITAHQHQSGIAIQTEQDKPRAMMTIGSRKQGDRYATRRGFTPQLPNKNLPVLEIIPGGYKILNDISLLGNEDERDRIVGKSLLTYVTRDLDKNQENGKLEKLKAMGFKNALPKGTERVAVPFQRSMEEVKNIDLAREKAEREKEDGSIVFKESAISKEIRLRRITTPGSKEMPDEDEKEEARKAHNREVKRIYRNAHREEYNKYSRDWKRRKATKKEGNDGHK